MRRRTADYRRPVRIRLSYWILAVLVIFLIAGFSLFLVQHNQHHDNNVEQPVLEIKAKSEQVVHRRQNFTEEISSARSYARQLAEQMTLAKAYVVIAKEHNNLLLAWELTFEHKNLPVLALKSSNAGGAHVSG
ncbi:putative galacturonosyltransferase 11 [Abeliophyllum distichum]|uniref:Galacturonosyltransferase 11 n=1 Tax=Abeliophyllum distichum TaxID=126358 RepID=A0ABD1PDR1_9LAMI